MSGVSHVNQNKTSPFEMDRINTFQKLPKAKPILPNGKESERVINLRKDGVSDFIEPQIFFRAVELGRPGCHALATIKNHDRARIFDWCIL